MSRRRAPSPGKLFFSVIYGREERFREALAAMEETFGEVGEVSGPFPFDRTGYYAAEMGAPLARRFVVQAAPVSRDALADAKIAAEALERRFAEEGRRTVNIDPGLMTPENMLLATGKNYSHRVYLGRGVFADLTLMFGKEGCRTLPWTYPDYADPAVQAFLAGIRGRFLDTARNDDKGENPWAG